MRGSNLEAGRVQCMRHARARLEKATVLREIVVVLVLRSPSASFAAWDAGPHVRPGFTLSIDMTAVSRALSGSASVN